MDDGIWITRTWRLRGTILDRPEDHQEPKQEPKQERMERTEEGAAETTRVAGLLVRRSKKQLRSDGLELQRAGLGLEM